MELPIYPFYFPKAPSTNRRLNIFGPFKKVIVS